MKKKKNINDTCLMLKKNFNYSVRYIYIEIYSIDIFFMLFIAFILHRCLFLRVLQWKICSSENI